MMWIVFYSLLVWRDFLFWYEHIRPGRERRNSLIFAFLVLSISFLMQNLRVKYYREGDWISEMKLAQGMSEEFYKECFQLHCYEQQYEKTGFFCNLVAYL